MISQQRVVHVGYIKTGTTFLQANVWTIPKNGMALAGGLDSRAILTDALIVCDDYVFEPGETRSRLSQFEDPLRLEDQIPVWSEETLLGNPPTRDYEATAKAARLHRVFPDAKILITIRRQQDMILSMYGEYLLGGGTLAFDSFIGDGNEPLSYTPILRPEFLLYDRAISYYQGLFGAENVLVLPMEMLTADKEAYFDRLAQFCGLTEPLEHRSERAHVGQRKGTLGLRRRLNRFLTFDPTRPGAHRSGAVRLVDIAMRLTDKFLPQSFDRRTEAAFRKRLEARYAHYFSQSNQATAEITGLDLAALGYQT